MTLEQRLELRALNKEIEDRREAIIQEWLKTHERPQRGIIAFKEQRELDLEAYRRFKEINDKYK